MQCLAALIGRLVQQQPNGSFNLLEAGVDEVALVSFPATVQLASVFRFRFDPDEAQGLHRIHTLVLLDDVALAPEQVVPILLKRDHPDRPSYFNALTQLILVLPAPGLLRVTVRIDGFGGAPTVELYVTQAGG